MGGGVQSDIENVQLSFKCAFMLGIVALQQLLTCGQHLTVSSAYVPSLAVGYL